MDTLDLQIMTNDCNAFKDYDNDYDDGGKIN